MEPHEHHHHYGFTNHILLSPIAAAAMSFSSVSIVSRLKWVTYEIAFMPGHGDQII